MSRKSEAKANFLKDLRALETEGKPSPKTKEVVEKEFREAVKEDVERGDYDL